MRCCSPEPNPVQTLPIGAVTEVVPNTSVRNTNKDRTITLTFCRALVLGPTQGLGREYSLHGEVDVRQEWTITN